MTRSALSVILGFATILLIVVVVNNFLLVRMMGISWQAPGGPEMVAMGAVGAGAGMAGGVITALTALHHPIIHTLVLAGVNWALNFWSLWANSVPGQPAWFWVFMAVLSGLSVLAGGYLFTWISPAGSDPLERVESTG